MCNVDCVIYCTGYLSAFLMRYRFNFSLSPLSNGSIKTENTVALYPVLSMSLRHEIYFHDSLTLKVGHLCWFTDPL
jgi:hypothetical protein